MRLCEFAIGDTVILMMRWFGERADRIILLFDAHKLDISDEFKTAIEAIKGHEDKVQGGPEKVCFFNPLQPTMYLNPYNSPVLKIIEKMWKIK